jgi:hypothetical protein
MPDGDATGEKDGEQNNSAKLGKPSWMVMVVGGVIGGVLLHVAIHAYPLKDFNCFFSGDPYCGQVRIYSDLEGFPCRYWIEQTAKYCGESSLHSDGPQPDDSDRCHAAWKDLNNCKHHAVNPALPFR